MGKYIILKQEKYLLLSSESSNIVYWLYSTEVRQASRHAENINKKH